MEAEQKGGGRTDNQSQIHNTKQRAVSSRQFFHETAGGRGTHVNTSANKAG